MCDCLCALAASSATGTTLFAKNSDRPPHEPQRLEEYPSRRDGDRLRTTYVDVDPFPRETVRFVGSRPDWQWGVEHGVNDAGVAAGNETIYTTLDPRRFPPALLGMDLVRLALERAITAAEAVEVMTGLLERYGQGGPGHPGGRHPYWSSFLIADPAAAYVVETSGRTWAAEAVEGTRAISNRTTIPAFDAVHRHPRQPVERLVDPRWRASQAVLAAEPVTVEALHRHLRSHVGDDGYTVCMHAAGVEATTAAMVAALDPGPLQAWFLLGSPCTSVFVPLFPRRALGTPLPWERFAALRREHRPVLDRLEQSLAADAVDDDGWAPEAWARIDAVLTSLGCQP